MKVLVVIASFGMKNEPYLFRVLEEYRRMPHAIDIVVLSNIAREFGPGIKVVVGLPGKDPHTLPFGHKEIFGKHVNDYDLFIYTEDDMLITQRNIEAFLRVTAILPEEELAGFVHFETDPQGEIYYDPPHVQYHWDPNSVRTRGGDVFAQYTNEHSACFLLTQKHLRRAIQSGGFLVPPHVGRYNLACSASTDPYTQCGFQKVVCVSRLEDFRVQHLPANKWKDRPYRHASLFHSQIRALLDLQQNGRPRGLLFPLETKLPMCIWSKDYYEPVQMVSLIPPQVRSVLSVGCGWGVTEEFLIKEGRRVVGLPLDSVIGACAEARGVEMVWGDLDTARERLAGERFDCVLLSNVLHLVPNPEKTLASFAELLSPNGIALLSVPNLSEFGIVCRRILRHSKFKDFGNYDKAGLHVTSHRIVRRWLRTSRLTPERIIDTVPVGARRASRWLLGLADPWLGSELIAIGRKD
jgi:SAM-dependent methyltransferase